ncbi:MAG: nucleotide exchange factor GrpE [Muribaculaceae bacterium]
MSKNKNQDEQEQEINTQATAQETAAATDNVPAEDVENAEGQTDNQPEESADDKIEQLTKQVEDSKKEYLFLMAEFDNFRKRTIREKADLIRNGAEKAFGDILPIVDDFERAIKANETADDINAVKEGFNLIYTKFIKYLEKNQVKAMQSTGCDFDTEMHEAVTTFPAADESMKGKIIDTVLTGYTINDKVLRHAKVVVGQ